MAPFDALDSFEGEGGNCSFGQAFAGESGRSGSYARTSTHSLKAITKFKMLLTMIRS